MIKCVTVNSNKLLFTIAKIFFYLLTNYPLGDDFIVKIVKNTYYWTYCYLHEDALKRNSMVTIITIPCQPIIVIVCDRVVILHYLESSQSLVVKGGDGQPPLTTYGGGSKANTPLARVAWATKEVVVRNLRPPSAQGEPCTTPRTVAGWGGCRAIYLQFFIFLNNFNFV